MSLLDSDPGWGVSLCDPTLSSRGSSLGGNRQTVDEEPKVSARECLRHTLATLAYRGGKVLRGAPPDFGSYRVGGTSRTPSEILAHVCDLLDWSLSLVAGQEVWRDSSPATWDTDVQRFFVTLGTLDDCLAAPGAVGCPWTRLFQGPIADAFTHIGQLALLRRLAGSAVRGENYFKADIASGRVGADQAAPRREFE